MSTKDKSNSSCGDHPHEESNIEDNEGKLRDVISSLRDLVSGEADIILIILHCHLWGVSVTENNGF
jgi:hypothetical protein